MTKPEILHEKIGRCGVIILDRPQALNALSFAMVAGMRQALDSFARDAEIGCVVVRSANARAFCAGADIKRVAELGRSGRHAEQLDFLAAEYRNCHRIKTYPKPYVSLVDGIIMGGGAGIAINGAHCVVGDNVSFAMPEVGIGFFPDVGASYFLARLPSEIGAYLALTGNRAGLGDLVALGLASAHVPSKRFDALFARLADGEEPERAIADEAAPAPEPLLMREAALLSFCFAPDDLAGIFARIESRGGASPFAQATLKTLRARSPTSLAIGLRQMRLGAEMDFDDALRMEFGIAARIIHGHDFYEGVRATLVDKDHAPRWQPAGIGDLDASAVDAYFMPAAQAELEFAERR